MTETAPATPRQRIATLTGFVFRLLAVPYGILTTLYLVGRLFIGEQFILIAVLNTFAWIIWLPGLILLLLAFLLRGPQRWFVRLLLVPPALAFLLTYGALFLPRSPQAPEAAPRFSLMTFNLLRNNDEYDLKIDLMRDSGADVIALQELTIAMQTRIAEDLADDYPHQALHPNSYAGQGILSRYAITEDDYWQHDWLPNYLGHQRTVIQLADDQPVTIYNLHPIHPGMTGQLFDARTRGEDLEAALVRARAERGPVILTGDFNLTDTTADYARIRQNFQDAWYAAGFGMGFTFPHNTKLPPLLRLDYVFYSDGIQPLTTDIQQAYAGSDHFPLMVTLAVLPD